MAKLLQKKRADGAIRERSAAARRRRLDLMADRRFPPPWTAEQTEACFIVKDKNDPALAYVYFEDEPGRRTNRERP